VVVVLVVVMVVVVMMMMMMMMIMMSSAKRILLKSWLARGTPFVRGGGKHPIIKHPQLMFLPQCVRPSFTPIKKQQAKLYFLLS
jgi:uncharacterized membrane protein YqiK